MKLSQFNFSLDQAHIASEPTVTNPGNHHREYLPAFRRDDCKMMVVHKDTGVIEHRKFKDIIEYFDKDDVFVLNDSKVIPARLYGNKEKTGADIEVFLLRELNREQRLWDVIVEPARKIRIGNKLYFGPDGSLVAEVIDNTTSRGRTLRFLFDGPYEEFRKTLFSYGVTPVQKWVKNEVTERDKEDYQTIFAKNEGSVCVPAAGLHFTRNLMLKMQLKDIRTAYITHHMSICHFKGVDVEDLSKHKMDSEHVIITPEAAQIINQGKRSGHQVLAVGITTMRALETYVTTTDEVIPFDGWTDKFIFPPYRYAVPTAIVTNFHLPYSTMLMAVSAFTGHELTMKAYGEALKKGYLFGPYGDAMLVI